jgi:hypothetical protein
LTPLSPSEYGAEHHGPDRDPQAPRGALKTIIAFANTAGGILLVGVEDRSRHVRAAIGLSPRATRTRLARLVGRGLVREIGAGPQDPRRRYFLAERGSA